MALRTPVWMHATLPARNAHAPVHASPCNGVETSLPWKLLRTYFESCASIVQAVICRLLLPHLLLSLPNPSPDAVHSRNSSKSTLAHDAVAAAVSHKNHSIIRVGAGLIQFVYGSYSRLATEVILPHKISFPPFFSRAFSMSCSVLLCVFRCGTFTDVFLFAVCCSVLQCVAVYCSVLQCVAVCYSVLLIFLCGTRYSSGNASSRWALYDSLAANRRPAHSKDRDLDHTCTEETRKTVWTSRKHGKSWVRPAHLVSVSDIVYPRAKKGGLLETDFYCKSGLIRKNRTFSKLRGLNLCTRHILVFGCLRDQDVVGK